MTNDNPTWDTNDSILANDVAAIHLRELQAAREALAAALAECARVGWCGLCRKPIDRKSVV